MSDNELLDSLLAVINETPEPQPSFDKALTSLDNVLVQPAKEKLQSDRSTIHNGDTDSSEDEDNRDFENRQYTEYGRSIKHLLRTQASTSKQTSKQLWTAKPSTNQSESVRCEVLFGIQVANPLVTVTVLEERMGDRTFIPLSRIKTFTRNVSKSVDWVVAGAIVHKSPTKVSSKGKNFMVWTLSDLKMELKTISLFLFGRAYDELWKTTVGTVVGILNPSLLDARDGSKDEAQLSINNHQLVMLLGNSRDLGTCKSVKKGGERCTAFVNVSICEFCVYHIKTEYQKCSLRSELQSSFSGRGLNALRNKVLGKDQVFYAGKLYSAIPKNRQTARDQQRLKVLEGNSQSVVKRKMPPQKKAASQLEMDATQRCRDLERLKKLGVNSPVDLDNKIVKFNADHSREVSCTSALDAIQKLKESKAPTLSSSATIDLNLPITRKETIKARQNALTWVQTNGPIQKQDPNSVRGKGKKRALDVERFQEQDKKAKVEINSFSSDRFRKIMTATSAHNNLLAEIENERQEKYFQKLEMKERMEEKMATTYKVQCKAVRCLKCKYTNFSASDTCKTERHPLKVFDAVKRFFKCGECSNRTACLTVVPTLSCKNCGSSKWERTSMMKERTEKIAAPTLSIRGGEQVFTNSNISNANLDLLVPE
ncbi:protein MCM10 homolog [Photinus pyralis]|uniref:protein MCM10 homolog n=1 Tax=Photinus pyralis TaxID=7054 RepID=UPI001267389A|nr:protein MCM10 homolog [Photinus pyralis]